MTEKHRSRLVKLYKEASLQRGACAESNVGRIVHKFIDDGLGPDWLVGYEPSDNRDDKRGIDGWFRTADVGKIPIQIKCSLVGATKALEKHPKIPVVIIGIKDEDDTIFNNCIGVISQKRDEYLKMRNLELT